WIKPKDLFTIHIEETGKNYSASVLRVGAEADPVSQTVKIVGAPVGEPAELMPGMSGVATFALPEGSAQPQPAPVSPQSQRAN
ncbi:MAG: HlyD family secretion protein, partial [Magnetococcales bacterium]|nr:HlyD family secretion protein [Magnetococcales bacterium]